jgi:hypothetical protein
VIEMPKAKEKGIALLAAPVAIADLSSATATTLYTVPIGKTCILSHAMVRVADDVGANLELTIGQVGALTDFVGTTNGDNLNALGDVIIMAPVPSATPATLKEYTAGEIIQIDVAVAGNAVAATVYLFGTEDDA